MFDCTSLTTFPRLVDFYSQIHSSRDHITHGEQPPAQNNGGQQRGIRQLLESRAMINLS